jgi:uncharacterized protein YggE
MRRIATLVVGAAVGLLALGATACTGETSVTIQEPLSSGISVSGTGRVTVVPDIGVLNVGVEVTRPTVAEARTEAARAMDAVRGSLTQSGVEERDIQTTFFNIQPQYDFNRAPDAGAPTIVGFIVTNQVTAKVRQVDTLSETLDAAVTAGGDAVRVNGVSFEVGDPEEYENEARDLAVADARARADQLAQLAGVQVGDVRSISETFGTPPPMPVERLAQAGADSTSISPGETEVTLTVNVVYEVQ